MVYQRYKPTDITGGTPSMDGTPGGRQVVRSPCAACGSGPKSPSMAVATAQVAWAGPGPGRWGDEHD